MMVLQYFFSAGADDRGQMTDDPGETKELYISLQSINTCVNLCNLPAPLYLFHPTGLGKKLFSYLGCGHGPL